MVTAGKVTGQTIGKNLDGKNNVRILQVEVTDSEDNQTIQAVYVGGEDNAPVVGSIVYILQISTAFKIVIGVDDQIEPAIAAGERKIYSSVDGEIKAFTHWKADGNQEINGSGDFAVRFLKLKETIDELQSDLADIKQVFSTTWVPVPNDGGAALKTAAATWAGSPLTKVIDPAKVETVELPEYEES